MIRTALIAAAIAFAAAAPAQAQPRDQFIDRASVAVAAADLNLDSELGAETLLRRLNRAARQVCRASGRNRDDIETRRAARACMDAALDRAVAQVDSPTVHALYASRYASIAQGDR